MLAAATLVVLRLFLSRARRRPAGPRDAYRLWMYGSARDCGASLSRAVYSRRHVRAFFTPFDTRLFESTPEPKIGLQQGPFVPVSDGVKSELE